jgi:hypothetical protein
VCSSSFIDRRRVRRIPHTLHRSKALKHGHCRVRTSSIGADRGDEGIWINVLAGSFTDLHRFIAINYHQQPPDRIWPTSQKKVEFKDVGLAWGLARILRSDGFISPCGTSSVSSSVAAQQSNPTSSIFPELCSASISKSILCFRSVLFRETQLDKIHARLDLYAYRVKLLQGHGDTRPAGRLTTTSRQRSDPTLPSLGQLWNMDAYA